MEYFNNSNCDFDAANRALANKIVAEILVRLGDPAGANPDNVKNAIDQANNYIDQNSPTIEIAEMRRGGQLSCKIMARSS